MFQAKIVALCALGIGATAALAGDVTVKMTGFRNQTGPALVYLWKAPDGFPKNPDKAAVNKKVQIEGNAATVVFSNVDPGVYAVSVTHDENNNGKMDTGFAGKPKEGYGASNNPKNKLSAPSFDQCKFTVDQSGKTLDIDIKY